MANIGKIAIKIVADASQVGEGTAKAGAAVKSFADSAVGRMLGVKSAAADAAGAIKGVGGAFVSAKSALSGGLLGSMGGLYGIARGGVSGGIGLVGSAISGTMGLASSGVSTLMGKWDELAPKIDRTAKDARRLGVSMEDMMGLEGFAGEAGIAYDDLYKMMAKFRLNDPMGNMVEALAKFADEVKAVESPSDRAAMAVEKFGKVGVKGITMLEAGGQAIRDTIKAYDALGYSMSALDAGKVEAANDAWQRVSFMMDGAWRRIVVAMAPAMQSVAESITAMAPTVKLVAERVGVALGEAIRTASVLVRVLVEDVLRLGDVFGLVNGKAGGAFGSMEEWTQGVKAALRSVATTFADIFDTIQKNLGPILERLGDSMTLAQRFAMSGAWGIVIDANRKDASNDPGQAIKALGKMLGGEDVVVGSTRRAMEARFAAMDAADRAAAKAPAAAAAYADSTRIDAHPVAVMEQQSREANETIARWRTEGNNALTVQKEQLEVQKEMRDALRVRKFFNVTDNEKAEIIDI